MPDNHLGFTAKRCQDSRPNQPPKLGENYEHDGMVYRQALRWFIQHYAELAIGILLTISPYKVLGWAFTLLSIQEIPEWFSVPGWGEVLRFGGLLLFLWGLRFIYSYFAIKLCFDNDGVILKKGIIAQDQVQIRFGDIKTIGVQQSILNRLLDEAAIAEKSPGTD